MDIDEQTPPKSKKGQRKAMQASPPMEAQEPKRGPKKEKDIFPSEHRPTRETRAEKENEKGTTAPKPKSMKRELALLERSLEWFETVDSPFSLLKAQALSDMTGSHGRRSRRLSVREENKSEKEEKEENEEGEREKENMSEVETGGVEETQEKEVTKEKGRGKGKLTLDLGKVKEQFEEQNEDERKALPGDNARKRRRKTTKSGVSGEVKSEDADHDREDGHDLNLISDKSESEDEEYRAEKEESEEKPKNRVVTPRGRMSASKLASFLNTDPSPFTSGTSL